MTNETVKFQGEVKKYETMEDGAKLTIYISEIELTRAVKLQFMKKRLLNFVIEPAMNEVIGRRAE